MQADVILKEPTLWVPPQSLSGGGARVEGGAPPLVRHWTERLLLIMYKHYIVEYCQELFTTEDCTDLRLRDIGDKYD